MHFVGDTNHTLSQTLKYSYFPTVCSSKRRPLEVLHATQPLEIPYRSFLSFSKCKWCRSNFHCVTPDYSSCVRFVRKSGSGLQMSLAASNSSIEAASGMISKWSCTWLCSSQAYSWKDWSMVVSEMQWAVSKNDDVSFVAFLAKPELCCLWPATKFW